MQFPNLIFYPRRNEKELARDQQEDKENLFGAFAEVYYPQELSKRNKYLDDNLEIDELRERKREQLPSKLQQQERIRTRQGNTGEICLKGFPLAILWASYIVSDFIHGLIMALTDKNNSFSLPLLCYYIEVDLPSLQQV